MSFLPPWFRIHLSTALVLMVAASGMLGLNVTRHQDDFRSGYGWPMIFLTPKDVGDWAPMVKYFWDYKNVVIDIVVYIGLLIVVAIILEKRIAILTRLKRDGE
ncbi:MAG: hypothetical protein WCT04_23025 [Planctomycetota bacterium]